MKSKFDDTYSKLISLANGDVVAEGYIPGRNFKVKVEGKQLDFDIAVKFMNSSKKKFVHVTGQLDLDAESSQVMSKDYSKVFVRNLKLDLLDNVDESEKWNTLDTAFIKSNAVLPSDFEEAFDELVGSSSSLEEKTEAVKSGKNAFGCVLLAEIVEYIIETCAATIDLSNFDKEKFIVE